MKMKEKTVFHCYAIARHARIIVLVVRSPIAELLSTSKNPF